MSTAAALVLAIDTCGLAGTVALAEVLFDTNTVTSLAQAELGSRAAAAELVPAIAALLEQTQRSLKQLSALVVVHGPGSFTGVRVGLSTAKGLAHASGLPVYAVSRLAVLSGLASDASSLALLDAGRGEFYARQREREWLASADEVRDVAAAGVPITVAEPVLAEQLAAQIPGAVIATQRPVDAMAAVRTALPRLTSGAPDDLSALDANYLRRSDAELFARPVRG